MLKDLFYLAFPVMISILLVIVIEFINFLFIGNLNIPPMLVGLGLGDMFINITTISVILGLNGALATLVS
jgi:Na+-driven multidrug efflux pump